MEKVLMLPIYKICEEVNGLGNKRYCIKYIDSWIWPFWRTLKEFRCDFGATLYCTDYSEALQMIEDLKKSDVENTYKRTKCTIIK